MARSMPSALFLAVAVFAAASAAAAFISELPKPLTADVEKLMKKLDMKEGDEKTRFERFVAKEDGKPVRQSMALIKYAPPAPYHHPPLYQRRDINRRHTEANSTLLAASTEYRSFLTADETSQPVAPAAP